MLGFRGFHLTLCCNFFQACVPPGAFLTGSSGIFSSPNFPNNFPANSICTWNITVPSGFIIKVSFLNFTFEPNQNTACIGEPPGARVLIINVASDDGSPNFQLCGQDLPSPVYSLGNSIQVRLVTLNNVYSGFKASYETIDAQERKFIFLGTRSIVMRKVARAFSPEKGIFWNGGIIWSVLRFLGVRRPGIVTGTHHLVDVITVAIRWIRKAVNFVTWRGTSSCTLSLHYFLLNVTNVYPVPVILIKKKLKTKPQKLFASINEFFEQVKFWNTNWGIKHLLRINVQNCTIRKSFFSKN